MQFRQLTDPPLPYWNGSHSSEVLTIAYFKLLNWSTLVVIFVVGRWWSILLALKIRQTEEHWTNASLNKGMYVCSELTSHDSTYPLLSFQINWLSTLYFMIFSTIGWLRDPDNKFRRILRTFTTNQRWTFLTNSKLYYFDFLVISVDFIVLLQYHNYV
jgi:hypothetical protein